MLLARLRQVDIKAEHFERQVQRVEAERDNWEKKYEDSQEVRATHTLSLLILKDGCSLAVPLHTWFYV